MKTPEQWLNEMQAECSRGEPAAPMLDRIRQIQLDAAKEEPAVEILKSIFLRSPIDKAPLMIQEPPYDMKDGTFRMIFTTADHERNETWVFTIKQEEM